MHIKFKDLTEFLLWRHEISCQHECTSFLSLWTRPKREFADKNKKSSSALMKRDAAAQIRARVKSCGICGGQSGTGVGILWVLRSLLPIIISPTVPRSSIIIWGWHKGPNIVVKYQVDSVSSDGSLAPPQETRIIMGGRVRHARMS
jgi:hypothetical protein